MTFTVSLTLLYTPSPVYKIPNKERYSEEVIEPRYLLWTYFLWKIHFYLSRKAFPHLI